MFISIWVVFLLVACGEGDGRTGYEAANQEPISVAGVAQNVVTGSTVSLDGSASRDANGDPLTYRWSLTSKPTGSNAVLASSTSAKPTFIADLSGTYVATLVVNDGKISSASSTVAVTSDPPKLKGVSYVAPNGMTVTLENFTQLDLGNGYTRYTATYRQENKTAIRIDEGSLTLHFNNASPEDQYGFFEPVLPGPIFALTRNYSWEVPSAYSPRLLQYKSRFFGEQLPGSLYWTFPLK